jgi:hypothetical protein
MDETRLKSARVKTSEGWVSFTRQFDDIESVVVSESNALVIRKPNGVFLKAGKPVTMTKRDVMAYVMKGRRKAGYEPVHKRPGVGPKISKAVKRSWKEGVGKYGKLKRED